MSGQHAAVFAVYANHAKAETALNALRDRGFAASDISVVAPRSVETAATTPVPDTVSSDAGSGAAPAIGVALSWLVGIGTVAMSGAMFVVAGPILATFKGVSDALLGIVDALVGFGIPPDEAKKYEDRVRNGAILLTVHAEDAGGITKSREVFEQTGAEDISSTLENKRTDSAVLEMPPR
jgi:hypothetical protein